MTTLFALVTGGPTVGDHDRKTHRTIEEALNALDGLPCEQMCHSRVEIIRGDYYWTIDNSSGTYRPFEQTPC